MQAGHERIMCPRCGAAVVLQLREERQGACPRGRHVTYYEITDGQCECAHTDAEWEDLIEQALEQASASKTSASA